MIEVVIFDCDGVLVDTEPIANRILAELATEAGIPTTTAESMNRYMGRSMATVVAMIEDQLGRPLGPGFTDDYYAKIFEAFETELTAIVGAPEAIEAVTRAGFRSCVASSGTHDKMRRTLGATGLLVRFEGRIFSASEVGRGKPAPDLFLHAAAAMGSSPDHCVVVEDSGAGVVAALAAGMRPIGLAGPLGRQPLVDAGAQVIDSLDELVGAILEGGP